MRFVWLCDSMDCDPPACLLCPWDYPALRILDWVAFPSQEYLSTRSQNWYLSLQADSLPAGYERSPLLLISSSIRKQCIASQALMYTWCVVEEYLFIKELINLSSLSAAQSLRRFSIQIQSSFVGKSSSLFLLTQMIQWYLLSPVKIKILHGDCLNTWKRIPFLLKKKKLSFWQILSHVCATLGLLLGSNRYEKLTQLLLCWPNTWAPINK